MTKSVRTDHTNRTDSIGRWWKKWQSRSASVLWFNNLGPPSETYEINYNIQLKRCVLTIIIQVCVYIVKLLRLLLRLTSCSQKTKNNCDLIWRWNIQIINPLYKFLILPDSLSPNDDFGHKQLAERVANDNIEKKSQSQ